MFMHTMSGGSLVLPPHLQVLNNALLDLTYGNIKRLLVTMPPRHGKSELCSRIFPAWYLGAFPNRRVILSSYESGFATQWGRKSRDTYTAAVQAGLFRPIKIRPDANAASSWELTTGGGVHTAGVGGSITGRGANLFIIDDPVKNAADALSATSRNNAWDWYTTTALSRLEPDASMLLMMTRWHVDDLAGRILADAEDGGTEPWTVISFPAIAEENDELGRKPGQALWPKRYDEVVLAKTQATTPPQWWSSLYQQSPVLRSGGMFSADWFVIVPAAPAEATRVRFWDRAATVDGDWTAGVKIATTGNGVYYVEDVVHFRGTPGENERRIRLTAQLDGIQCRIFMEKEGGSSGIDSIYTYSKLLAGFAFYGIDATGSKSVRAAPFASQCEMGNVKLVKGAWNKEYITELTGFPMFPNDDMVDASAGAFMQSFQGDIPEAESKSGWDM